MEKLILIFALVGLSACGSDDDAAGKSVFSIWTQTSPNAGVTMDMSAGAFSQTAPFSLFLSGGERCDCDLTVIGTEASGSYTLNSCSYAAGTGAGDPGCAATFNQSGNYTNTGAVLTLTGPNGTSTWN